MTIPRLFPRVLSFSIALALAITLLYAIPSQLGTQTASAQGTCPVGASCSNNFGFGSQCTSVAGCNYNGCGTSFNGSSNLGCSGNFYGGCSTSVAGGSPCSTAGSGCGSTLFGGGINGGSSLFGGGCGGGGNGGGCVGKVLQAGQSCSNGVISGTPTQTATTAIGATLAAASVARPAGSTTCPGGGFAPAGGSCSAAPLTASVSAAGAGTSVGTGLALAAPGSFSVSLPQGWSIVAGPAGTTLPGVTGTLFTWQPGDTAYESIPAGSPLKAGAGYWVNMLASGQTAIATAPSGSVTVTIPAGGQVMIGNPGNTVATVTGADAVVTYDPTSSTWSPVSQLQPGQGGWASSAAGATVTISNAPVPGS